MDLAIVLISPIFQKEKYNLDSITSYIEQNYPEFKYYAKYKRKTPSENIIFRFYRKQESTKITISILPAYILSRKQKSIKIFYDLLKTYTEKDISIEHLWSFFDNTNHFKSISTLRKYISVFIYQLDEILKLLTKKVVLLDSKNKYPDILPDENMINIKLQYFFKILNHLLKILHNQNIQIILEYEMPYYFHYFLFSESKIFLLNFP